MKVFNICDYGAVYSDKLQTKAIQNAIDDCFLAGGGRVLIPSGIYLTGGLRLRSNVELYLESGAILKGSRDPKDYMEYLHDTIEPVTEEEIDLNDPKKRKSSVATSRWSNGLIRALDGENIAVIGEKGSYIDGNNCFDPEGEENYRGPHGMSIWRCKNIRLEGYTFLHSANWCHAIFQSENITVRNVTVCGGHDGVDVRSCDNVLIENCEFQTGDDCVAGFDNNHVIIRNCISNSACNTFRFGGHHVVIENCRSIERPLRFSFRDGLTPEEKKMGCLTNDAERSRHDTLTTFSYYCDHRADPREECDVTIRNCEWSQAREWIRLEFDGFHRWCCNRSLKRLVLENVSVGEIIRAGKLWGDENEKLICHFKNVTIRAKEGFGHEPMLVAGNFEKMIFENCTVEGYDDPTILVGADDEVEFINSTPIKVKRASLDECIAAHPWGIPPQDRNLGQAFK